MQIKIITTLDIDTKKQVMVKVENRIWDALAYMDGVDKTSIETMVVFEKGPRQV